MYKFSLQTIDYTKINGHENSIFRQITDIIKFQISRNHRLKYLMKNIQLAKTGPGADCGSDHELLIAKFRLKLKKVGKPLDHSGMT